MKKKTNSDIISLSATFGIGTSTIHQTIRQAGLNPHIHNKKIPINILQQIKNILEKRQTAKILKTELSQYINLCIENKSYRGTRHRFNYPARGQRTHTNAKTAKKNYIKF